jgi:hypothetical protein
MDKRHLFGMAAALLIAGATPAAAVDNAAGDATHCECMCDLGNGAALGMIYPMPAGGCLALHNRTCNAESPAQPGLIRSGRVQMCEPHIEMEQSALPGDQDGWAADPGTSDQGGRWGGQAGPLLNGTFEQQ